MWLNIKKGVVHRSINEKRQTEFCKIREDNTCEVCEKVIKKGSWVLGKGWQKVCLSCANTKIQELISDSEAFKKELEEIITYMGINKNKLNDDNILANLRY